MNHSQGRILIALATYNERDNVAPLVAAIRATIASADVLILDDNSPDGTGAAADLLAQADAKVSVIHRTGKLGLGTAILTIMNFAMEKNYDLLLTMDADFSHDPRYLPDIVKGMEVTDIMIGSRYVPGGGVVNWPLSRRLMSRTTNRLVRLLVGMPIRDTSNNFRCYRVSVLRHANLDSPFSHGYSFLQEVLHRCHLAGARFDETPIVFVDRKVGNSKATLKEMAGSVSALVRLSWRAWFGRAALMPKADSKDASRLVRAA